MPLIDLEHIPFNSEKMRGLFGFFQKTLGTPAPIHISGSPGVGKTTWAEWLKSKWTTIAVFEWDGAGLNIRDFQKSLSSTTSGLVIIENVDALEVNVQRELNDFLEKRNQSNQVKLITTSRKNLQQLSEQGQFRTDLFYRLTIVHIALPDLREIFDEIGTYAEFYLRVFEILYKKNNLSFSQSAMDVMKGAPWKGNISELENVVERAVMLATGPNVGPEHINFQNHQTSLSVHSLQGLSLSEMERKLILQTLELADFNRTRTAHILGISIRTLRNKLNEYKEAGLI